MEVDEDGGGDDRDVTARRRVAVGASLAVWIILKRKKRFAALVRKEPPTY